MKYDPDEMLSRFHLTDSEKEFFKQKIFSDPKWRDGDKGFGYRDVLFYDTVKELPEKLQKVFYSLSARYDFELMYMPYNDGIDELIAELKDNGYKIYLLSNIGLSFHYFNKKVPVFSLFDGCFPSCDYGLIKPEKEVYNTFFRRFSLVPEECLFIDDTMENVRASEKAGMPAVCYNAVLQDIAVLRKLLSARGIRIGN
ncbi:MAG: HAD-IA family hydrolase [Clostridia bacterium]|nr:HAD-IA family hydrolase [Clostridia bacterium]